MIKKLSIIMVIILSLLFGCFINCSRAAVQPQYDATFNNNKGIFYANGNDIEIKEKTPGETVVTWNGGEQIVPTTVTIIGGGTSGTSFEKSNIKMTSGTVSLIYGGGICLDSNNQAYVEESNVEINGGTVLATVYGGGLIYSKVDTSNVTINNGTISAIVGGGGANTIIAGVAYSAGEQADLQNSKNRVVNANITINNGTINTTPSNYGLIFGGGQGYSFVEVANLTINGGDMSKAYVTSGGSNGYTEDAETIINGGTIKVLQSVNRGIVDQAEIEITGGKIKNAYLGGENDPSVTGIVNEAKIDIIGGEVEYLKKGTSNAIEIAIDQDNYKAVYIDKTVKESVIGNKEIKIKYELQIDEKEIEVIKGQSKQIKVNLKTTPEGYEYLFDQHDKIWKSEDEEIAIVNDGNIKGLKIGKTIVNVKMLDTTENIKVKVIQNKILKISLIILMIVLILLVICALVYIL